MNSLTGIDSYRVTYKTAWFMSHCIREALKDMGGEPMGGPGKVIEADETYFGELETPRVPKRRRNHPYKNKLANKRAVLGLVERGGKFHTFHIQSASALDVREVIVKNVSRKPKLHTDESRIYTKLGTEFSAHRTVNHTAGEYVRGKLHTNTVGNVWSVFKRGMKGIYQHHGESHSHRYLAEFDFRYTNRSANKVSNRERTEKTMEGA